MSTVPGHPEAGGPEAAAPPQRPAPEAGAWFRRLAGAATALPIAGVFVLAAALKPSTEGHGTHTQLGLPKCQWVSLFDKPCPTCGMTTSFSLAADARFVDAFLNQPMGMVLAVIGAATMWGGLHVALSGARVGPLTRFVLKRSSIAVFILAFFGAWLYKVATWG